MRTWGRIGKARESEEEYLFAVSFLVAGAFRVERRLERGNPEAHVLVGPLQSGSLVAWVRVQPGDGCNGGSTLRQPPRRSHSLPHPHSRVQIGEFPGRTSSPCTGTLAVDLQQRQRGAGGAKSPASHSNDSSANAPRPQPQRSKWKQAESKMNVVKKQEEGGDAHDGYPLTSVAMASSASLPSVPG